MLNRKYLILFVVSFVIFTTFLFISNSQFLPVSAEDAQELHGWAWSSTDNQGIGWISFNSKNCDLDNNNKLDVVCGGTNSESLTPYSVKLYKDKQLYGYAWSANVGMTGTDKGGMLYFGPPATSLANRETGEAGRQWAYIDGTNVKGWARFCSDNNSSWCESGATISPNSKNGGWDGWVSLSGTTVDGKTYGVKYNASSDPIPSVKGCDGSYYSVAAFSFYGCAWGGATFSSSNPNAQFPGWIDFNYKLVTPPVGHCDNGIKDSDETGIDCGGTACKSCPTIPGGPIIGGGHCTNRIIDSDENDVDCGGVDCPACVNGGPTSSGGPKCPDGSPNPNPNGVTALSLQSCPLYIHSCVLTKYGESTVIPNGTISVGNYLWTIIASGGTNFHYEWYDEGGIVSGCKDKFECPRNYSIGNKRMNVVVSSTKNDGQIESKPACGELAFTVSNNPSTEPFIDFYNLNNNSSDIRAKAKFIGTTASVYDELTNSSLIIRVGETNRVCTGSISLQMISIEKLNGNSFEIVPQKVGTVENYSIPSITPGAGVIPGETPFKFSNLTLKNKTIWPITGSYQIRVRATTSDNTRPINSSVPVSKCKSISKDHIIPLRIISSGGGEYIEQ